MKFISKAKINFNPLSIIRNIFIFVLIIDTILYCRNWIQFNGTNFFTEAINDFYSKVYLIGLIICLIKRNKITYFLCIILLPMYYIYRLSGILFCCTTPFDYTFEIYSFVRDSFKNTPQLILNLIIGFSVYFNVIIFVTLLFPSTRKKYFNR